MTAFASPPDRPAIESQPRGLAGPRFGGRIVLITGAAGGLGASHARGFAAEGATVVATDVSDRDGEALTAELGSAVRYEHLDVTSFEDWRRVASVVGPIDVLVNNAGVGATGGVLEQTIDEYRRVMDVNVFGTMLGMRTFVPGMVERKSGSVINVASIAGLVGRPNGLAYTASKWAIRGLTKTAALDVADTGVRINAVNPGIIRTAMTEGISLAAVSTQPIARLGEPSEVTRVVLFLASDEASYCTGADFVVDGGYSTGIVVRPPV
jgi:3alpha(or 20beta)-hydroxysteroid dehydrogenase